jgi:hypothetical protein
LPPEEEELLFRDDKESTLREIVDHFIYKWFFIFPVCLFDNFLYIEYQNCYA